MENLDLTLINSFDESNTYENRLMDRLDSSATLYGIEKSIIEDY